MNRLTQRMSRALGTAALVLVVLGVAAGAQASDREGRWDFSLGAVYQDSSDMNLGDGSTMNTDGELGFVATAGYNITDKFATNFGFQYSGVGYNADTYDDGGAPLGISGSYDTWTMSANAIFNIMDGPITPYVGAGLGWTWIDTNIPSGPPSTGCWWDPWWGYVCYTSYPSHSIDAFSYQAVLGVRWELNDMTFLRFGYVSQWMDFDGVESTPRFDALSLEIGWIF